MWKYVEIIVNKWAHNGETWSTVFPGECTLQHTKIAMEIHDFEITFAMIYDLWIILIYVSLQEGILVIDTLWWWNIFDLWKTNILNNVVS